MRVALSQSSSLGCGKMQQRAQWKFIFLASQVTARNYYVNVEELVKSSLAIVNWRC